MTIPFAPAWAVFEIGNSIAVSDGTPAPIGDLALKVWNSRNFEGLLIEKVDGPPRQIVVQKPASDGVQVGHILTEGDGANFSAGEGEVSTLALIAIIRFKRDMLIKASDYVEFSRRLTQEQRTEGLAYRDALFDLPEMSTPVWPTPPSWLNIE